MTPASIPPIPTEPDPSNSAEDWAGTKDGCPRGETIVGHMHDRRIAETTRGDRVVLEVATGDGDVVPVPCFRTHLRELVAENDPQPGDGIAIVYFGPEPGKKKELYAMRVDKSARLSEQLRGLPGVEA